MKKIFHSSYRKPRLTYNQVLISSKTNIALKRKLRNLNKRIDAEFTDVEVIFYKKGEGEQRDYNLFYLRFFHEVGGKIVEILSDTETCHKDNFKRDGKKYYSRLGHLVADNAMMDSSLDVEEFMEPVMEKYNRNIRVWFLNEWKNMGPIPSPNDLTKS